jgi:hypothetical protein
MERHEIETRFRHHPPVTPAHVDAHESVRDAILELAHELNDRLPEGRSKALAFTALEEAGFHSHAALARHRAEAAHGQPAHTLSEEAPGS